MILGHSTEREAGFNYSWGRRDPQDRALCSWGAPRLYIFQLLLWPLLKVSAVSWAGPTNSRPRVLCPDLTSPKTPPASPSVRPWVLCAAEALPLDHKRGIWEQQPL